MTGFRIALGGTAVVCCPHDREKRRVTTDAQVAALGATVGQVYDPAQHKLHLCACCRNLFVDATDTPRLCSVCLRPTVHPHAGLPDPIGAIE